MPLTEYDCTSSTAIHRVALNKLKNELIVIFEGRADIYLYFGVPSDIEADLISGSKGNLVNRIKTITKFRKISSFPRDVEMYRPRAQPSRSEKTSKNKTPRENNNRNINAQNTSHPKNGITKMKPRFKDYSNRWLDALATNTTSLEYLESLLHALLQCHPQFPPAKKPPRVNERRSTNTNSSIVVDDIHGVSNIFSGLRLDDDVASSDDNDGEFEHPSNPAMQDNMDSSAGVQSRYLIVRVHCSIAEYYRNEAMSALRGKDFVNVRLKWQQAWDQLQSCQVNIDEWYALLCHQIDDPFNVTPFSPPLPKKHDRSQLVELFNVLQLLIDDTERQRASALDQLNRQIGYIHKKLNPMLRDRNEVKSSMGEERWTNNPEPKQTYAEKRKEWEESLRLLNAAVNLVCQLNFNEFYGVQPVVLY